MEIVSSISPEQTLALFHQGEWAQALSALQQAQPDRLSAEAAAALGICHLFADGPLDLEAEPVQNQGMQTTLNLLQQGETSGWPEVTVCRTWLQLLQEKQSAPAQLPAALEPLLEACRQVRWFPVRSLALRALVYFDRRQQLRELLATAGDAQADNDGFKLTLAEARLECSQRLAMVDLQQTIVPACPPLAPEVAELWRHWLLAEFACWEDSAAAERLQVQADLAAYLEAPCPSADPYSAGEWCRLSYHAMLWQARQSLSQARFDTVRYWLDRAARHRPEGWEWRYLYGLLAWSRQDYHTARTLLEQSLTANPFQSRVRFELGMLLAGTEPTDSQAYLESLPGVHDAAASLAVVYYRLGKVAATRHYLAQLEQEEGPYSLRLLWPQAQTLRLCQGRELRAHLAETGQDWLKALESWDAARQVDLAAEQTRRHSPHRSNTLSHRAHRLYLLERYLRSTDSADRGLQQQFHKELARLSLRTLLGDAMFYRGLAAEQHLPERALADWRALIRQTAWLEKNRRLAPDRLLCLGDRLLRNGCNREAHQAYVSAVPDGSSSERIIAGTLLIQTMPEAGRLLEILETVAAIAPRNPLWLLLRGLCLLAREPSACETAQTMLEQAYQAGLSLPLQELGGHLLAVVTAEADASERVAAWLEKQKTTLPPSLELGLAILGKPQGLTTLRGCKALWGAHWRHWCPLPPTVIVGLQLRHDCNQCQYAAALEQIDAAATLGIRIPVEWRAYVYLMQAVQMGMRGDFDAAAAALQSALSILSTTTTPDLPEAGRR
ncbi:MAG: hypothetical protein U1F76_19870 [Candidatus Competibacteraceae bacterium]